MIKRLIEDVKFVAGVVVAMLYGILFDLAYQTKFCAYRGEIIVTYTKYQRILSAMFYPLLVIGIITIGLLFYKQYLDMVRKQKRYKHLREM